MLLWLLAAVSAGLVIALLAWGGRIEATLLVFGELVFVTLDGSNPRILFMLSVPIFFVVLALRLRARREQI